MYEEANSIKESEKEYYMSREELDFRKKQQKEVYFTNERKNQLGDGSADIVVGAGTAIGGGTILVSSAGVDYVSFGITVIPTMGAKALGTTGVVVGTNKFVTGIAKVFNAIYGREVRSTLNPIKDGLLKINPTGEARDFYNALEIVTEVGVGQLAPYAIGLNKKDTVYRTEEYRNYLSGSKRLQFNQPKNLDYQKVRNNIEIIDNIEFSGHALDRMQDRGIPISVVKETIQYGIQLNAEGNRIKLYDVKNNISVILEKSNRRVITVEYGK